MSNDLQSVDEAPASKNVQVHQTEKTNSFLSLQQVADTTTLNWVTVAVAVVALPLQAGPTSNPFFRLAPMIRTSSSRSEMSRACRG